VAGINSCDEAEHSRGGCAAKIFCQKFEDATFSALALEGFAGQPPKPLNRPTKKIMIFDALRVYKVRIRNIYIRA
jgi:hypothetical protein